MKLADSTVEAAVCPPGRKDALYFDDACKGFGLRVTAHGKRVFIFQYRIGSRVRRTVLGTYGKELTTKQARNKAESLRGQVRDRRDPVAEHQTARALVQSKEREAKAAKAAAAFMVDTLIEQWTAHHLAHRSASYRKRVPAELRRGLARWLEAPAAEFGHRDAVQTLDAVTAGSGPVAGNRFRAEARSCWGWAVKRGALVSNPWEATPKPLAREVPRERVLSDQELAALYAAADDLPEPWTALIKVLIITGQRRGEVAGMRWDELDLKAGGWSLPGSRTKNRQPHHVPLSPEAVAILKGVKRTEGAVFVFEGPRRTAVSGFGKMKQRLDVALAAAAPGRKPDPWILHDLRRTTATGLQRLGVRLEVTEAILNHVSGSRAGIVGIYQRHGWEREKADALRAWARHVLQAGKSRRRAA